MIIVDEPYVSEELKDYLQSTSHPVLDNAMARLIVREGYALELVDDSACAEAIGAGQRLYTTSENALAWVNAHVHNPAMLRAIEVFKDKALMRQLLAPLYPDFAFRTLSFEEMLVADFPAHAVPFVLKPSIGFCSVGVYTVTCEEDWEAARAAIKNNVATWQTWYPQSVVGGSAFVIESYIEGTEFAIDAYYDQQGCACVLDILQHDFASTTDTSDRLYYTGAPIIREHKQTFTTWLDNVNALVKVRDFPVHVEVRVQDGRITPIEFNPLRFAGLGGTEIAYYGYGFHPYDQYLHNSTPDWNEVLRDQDDRLFCMSVLGAPADMCGTEIFDYESFLSHFKQVFCLNRFDYHSLNAFGFLFFATSAHDSSERDFLLNVDLREFLH
ncbi:MAG: ATP-grasp domain-containing protein [Raoultibacter sp.]